MLPVQQSMLKLLKEIDAICRKYNITYYLAFGSALGAIRHKGFLPWDDDMDLFIRRDQWERLCDVIDCELAQNRAFLTYRRYPSYKNVLSRYIDCDTTAITKGRIIDGTPKGQFVEFFILDPMPLGEEEQNRWKTELWIYTELLSGYFSIACKRMFESFDMERYRYYEAIYKKLGREKTLALLEERLFCYEAKEASHVCSRWGIRHIVYENNCFGIPRYVPFEDMMAPVATRVEDTMRIDYGDNWMYIPSSSEQIVHGYNENQEISYIHFVDDYMQFLNKDKLLKCYDKRKEAAVESFYRESKFHLGKQHLFQIRIEMELEQVLDKNNPLPSLLEKGNYKAIKKIFSTWYERQFSIAFWKWNTFLTIRDEWLYYALYPLLMDGEFSKAFTILNWRSKKTDPMDSKLQLLFDETTLIRNAYIHIDNKRYVQARQLLESAQAPFDQALDIQKMNLFLCLKNDLSLEDLQMLKQLAERLSRHNPKNGEIRKLMADIYWKLDEKGLAYQNYQTAYITTSHGFVRMELEERFPEFKQIAGAI